VGERLVDSGCILPKYSQIKEYLKKQIRQGEIVYRQQLASENILAKQFGMSRQTVRKALGDLENEGWIEREQGRGTFCIYRERVARGNIAVLATYISEYIFPTLIRGIEEVLSAAGYTLILANTNNDKVKEALCLENILNQDIAGVIIEPAKSSQMNVNIDYFREFERRRIPYLMVHAFFNDLDPAYIMMDDYQGGYLAAQYLIQIGHREIAAILKSDDRQGVSRQAGFLAALNDYHISIRHGFLGNYQTEQLLSYPYQFTRNLLQKKPRPTALICYNDQIALKVMEAIRDEGLKIPDDISIIGYDDSSLATASEIKLTTIKHPKADMGRQAAKFMIDMVEGKVLKPRFVYQPEIIIRSSCRSLCL
jgi:GntR family transcriptional regulator, arabinose operon transcriptional repressor